jgi:hypothetical protein
MILRWSDETPSEARVTTRERRLAPEELRISAYRSPYRTQPSTAAAVTERLGRELNKRRKAVNDNGPLNGHKWVEIDAGWLMSI